MINKRLNVNIYLIDTIKIEDYFYIIKLISIRSTFI